MARGFGAKPMRTGKCKCTAPRWHAFALRITDSGTLVITLECQNCKALWDSKSRDSRQYVQPDGMAHFNNRTKQITTYQDIMERADNIRRDYLLRQIKNNKEAISEMQKEIDNAQKELDSLS